MRSIYEKYHLPMMVTENGLAYSDSIEDGKFTMSIVLINFGTALTM